MFQSYGACIDPVENETQVFNNCSSAVTVSVTDPATIDDFCAPVKTGNRGISLICM
jgi:hypothetical protein